jgi:hypothetical protein
MLPQMSDWVHKRTLRIAVAISALSPKARRHAKTDVRFGSLADICNAKGHVSIAPNSDRESGLAKTVPLCFWKRTCAAQTRRQFGPDRTILRKNFAKDNDQTREDRP